MKVKNLHLFVPNALTLLNLFLGCIGIVYAFDERYFVIAQKGNVESLASTFEVNSRLFISAMCVFTAAAVDFLDGYVARALKAESVLGKELDSLADVVTFGVLPGMIYYQLLERSFFLETGALYTSKAWLLPAFLIPLGAAYRLARFNVQTTSKEYFTGMAAPAQGLFAASLPIIYFYNTFGASEWMLNKWLLYGLVALFTWLMVSRIPMFSFKLAGYQWKGNEKIYVFLILCAALVASLQFAGVAAAILLYIVFALFVIKPVEAEEV
ncbi:MAG TPA: CDP-alcohol phosphatidyltransferase family protein [Chitinophagales bacterium]|nr:CDP-alcohol phosphatidyltransferase family protein [Chitinophagales bacterium]